MVVLPDKTELEHDKVPPMHRMIDFDEHMDEMREKTELEVPYCITQCEDCMYLDKF
jgi:hypothetical protein